MVIGGCGFLGQHLCERLLERGYSVRVFDIRKTFENEKITFIIGDLCKKEVSVYLIFFQCHKMSIMFCTHIFYTTAT